jgi:hypothetical protein
MYPFEKPKIVNELIEKILIKYSAMNSNNYRYQ